MSGRRRQGLSPSLFPFLAVLVCTLGTLILLLALVAQNATEAAKQRARLEQAAKAAPAVEEADSERMTRDSVDALIEEEEFRITELVAVRDQQTSELGTRRDELTHLDEHIERLRKQMKLLNEEVLQATGELQVPEIGEEDIAQVQDQIELEKKELEKLRKETSERSPRVVIVPHKGPNGTDRRPVYLECKADGITIWPEGSKITIEQLENAGYAANPLDAALRTIRMHVMRVYKDSVPPYPLLVVRPDGIDTYGMARRAMRDWDDQFGYELVPEKVELAFSDPDVNLKRRIEIAVNSAAAQQRVQMEMSQRDLNHRGYDYLGNRRRTGTGTAKKSLPILSAAALDQAGRANGFAQLRDQYRGTSSSPINGSPYTQGPRIGAITPNAYSNQDSEIGDAGAAARQMAQRMQSAAQEMRTDGGNGYLPSPVPESTVPESTTVGLGRPSGSGIRESEGNQLSESSPGYQRDQIDSLPRYNLDSGAEYMQNAPRDRRGSAGESVAQSTPGIQMPGEFGDERATRDGLGDRSQAATAPNAGNRQHNASSDALNDPNFQHAAAANQGSTMAQSMLSPPTNPQAAAMSGSPTITGSPLTSDQSLADDPRLDELDLQDPGINSPQLPDSSPTNRRLRDLVQRNGDDWALPDSMAGTHGNAIVRTMRLQCYDDRFVLLPAKNEGATEIFGFFDGDIERASLELATVLRNRIQRWGPALPGGRWQPRLEVQIKPGSEMSFHQLRELMSGSGIELVGRISP